MGSTLVSRNLFPSQLHTNAHMNCSVSLKHFLLRDLSCKFCRNVRQEWEVLFEWPNTRYVHDFGGVDFSKLYFQMPSHTAGNNENIVHLRCQHNVYTVV